MAPITTIVRREGIVIADVFADLGVTMSQHNYVEAVPYDGTAPPASSS